MATTIADFRARFPQFSADPPWTDDLIDAGIQEALCRVSQTCFGAKYEKAICYLAAHILTLTVPGGSASVTGSTGQIASVSAGSASVSYVTQVAQSGDFSASLRETSFGRLYLDLLRLCGPGARVLC